jgi:hypothetical protein
MIVKKVTLCDVYLVGYVQFMIVIVQFELLAVQFVVSNRLIRGG